MSNKIWHKGVNCHIVEFSQIFEASSIFKNVRARGDIIVFNSETRQLDIAQSRGTITYTDSRTDHVMQLPNDVVEAQKMLSDGGFNKGVIACDQAEFSTYYTGAITKFMRQLWARANR